MRRFNKILTLLLFLVIIVLFFNGYFFRGKPLFPGNLLVSFYSPWKYEVFPDWEHGIPSKPLGFDNLRFFYPLKTEVLRQFQEGELPLWNPYNFSGNVLLANSQSAVLYPLNLLFFFLPFMDAWSLFVVFVPLITGGFTYVFLRTLKLSKISSLFGAFSFGFSGFLIVWMEENPAVSHSAIWLPVALYAIKNFINQKLIRFWFLAIFALVSSILAGFLQIAIYLWIFSLSYAIYEFFRLIDSERRKLVFPLIGVFFFSFLISAVQLVPSFEAFLSSARITASTDYLLREYLLPLTSFMTFVIPDIFGNPGTHNFFGGGFYYDKILYLGLIPLLFALYALFLKERKVGFFVFWVVVTLILGFNNPIAKMIFGLKIPFLSAVTPSRIFYLTAFSLAILAAFGLEAWLKKQDKISLVKVILIILAGFFLAGLFSVSRLMPLMEDLPIKTTIVNISQLLYPGIPFGSRLAFISLRNLLASLGVFFVAVGILIFWIKKPRWKRLLLLGLIVVFILHQYYFAKKSFYATESSFIFPQTAAIKYLKENANLDRIIGVGQARIFPNLLTSFRLFSPEGLDPVFSRSYGELINRADTGLFTTDIPRIEAKLVFESEEDFKNKTKVNFLSFLGVKFLLAPRDFLLPQDQFKKVWNKGDLTIWENKLSFPRCWLINEFMVEKKSEEIIKKMFSENFNLKTQVVLEEDPLVKLSSLKADEGKVEIMEYNADSLKTRASAAGDSIMLCSDNFFPGWKAKIDGAESKIYRADYAFRAVVIPAGTHEIIFSYEPLTFKYGSLISVLGLLGAGIYAVFWRRLR